MQTRSHAMTRLADKVALITADDRGLAAAVAVAFGRAGATVVITDRAEARLAPVAEAVRATGAACLPLVIDPLSPQSCESAVAQVVETYGRLDILCNLAGEFSCTGPLHEVDEAEFDRAVAANIKSVLLMSRFAVPAIRRTSGGRGSIINLSHVAALNGVPGTGLLAAAKGALHNMTQNMAQQGQREGFRVNCVCVGSRFVPVIPGLLEEHRQQPTPPDELAPTFVYLASDESRHVNGHMLVVDDGMHAWIEGAAASRQHAAGQPAAAVTRSPATALGSGYMAGEVVLITAGGGGIGRATAKLLAAEGAQVMVADLNGEAAAATAAEVCAAGGQAHAVTANALAADDCGRVVGQTIERFGKLTSLINLVGFFGKGDGMVDTVSLAEWDWMMDINLKSVFLMSKYALPALMQAGGGSIVNTGTLAAVIARGGSPSYGAPKAGVLALTQALAADYAKAHIRVNAVCPSATDTGMFANFVSERAEQNVTLEEIKAKVRQGDQGLSTPAQIAPAFLFLASDQLSPKVTGHILMADNGFSLMRR
jgi:NAD(P)-dependent dehydrogenase (short-subunit alcohol dehydrogenase family)